MPKAQPFKRESDLCAAFIASIGEHWTAYAETAGWDILLVRKPDGFQIGVQAKLKLNAFVLAQTLETRYAATAPGPDCRAVLVPYSEVSVGIGYLAAYVGITVIHMEGLTRRYRAPPFTPDLPRYQAGYDPADWYEWAPTKRCKLPEYIPDVAAGVKSPMQLTNWKIGALRIEVLLELNGYVTREDFRNAGIDYRRWIAKETGWLRNVDGRWVRAGMPDFKGQHPKVYKQIKADIAKWRKIQADAQAALPLTAAS